MLTTDWIWSVLGVESGADAEAVKRSYRVLALRHHPDRNPGDPDARTRFDQLNEAYAAWLHLVGQKPATSPPPSVDVSEIFTQFSGLFGDVFAKPTGGDRKVPLVLSEDDMRHGCFRELAITRAVLCQDCKGSGDATGEGYDCPACASRGQQTRTEGFLTIAMTCSLCRGRKKIPRSACRSCKDGLREQIESARVTVPPGVTVGQMLRLVGKGDERLDAQPGNLYLAIELSTVRVRSQRVAPRGGDPYRTPARVNETRSAPAGRRPTWAMGIALLGVALGLVLLRLVLR